MVVDVSMTTIVSMTMAVSTMTAVTAVMSGNMDDFCGTIVTVDELGGETMTMAVHRFQGSYDSYETEDLKWNNNLEMSS